MNFVGVGSFSEADEKLIAAANSGACEVRPVISGGKLTGESRKVCQNGTATWTPGDVKVAREVGGLAAVASTKEYMCKCRPPLSATRNGRQRIRSS